MEQDEGRGAEYEQKERVKRGDSVNREGRKDERTARERQEEERKKELLDEECRRKASII